MPEAIPALPPAVGHAGIAASVPSTKKPKRKYKTGTAAAIAEKFTPRKAAAKPRAKKAAAAPDTEPRITIRSRIVDVLRKGPQNAEQVRKAGGFDPDLRIDQHLYLLKRDGLATADDGVYSLVGK